jgi:8-hydroxy-5-deazaflavin:NADPH oxidoreductase
VRVAVIGTGRMGSALGATLAAAGHEVRMGSRDPERGREAAVRAGAASGGGYAQAAGGAEAIVLAVPWSAMPATLAQLGDLRGRILIDVTNPFGDEQLHGSSLAEELQALVPYASVVKAWNTLYSKVVGGSPLFDSTPATVFVAGDDPVAKAAVAGLVRDLGWDAADAGPLASSRYLEPVAALMTSLDRMSGGRVEHALRLLRRDAPPRTRQTASGTSSKRSTSTSPRSVILSAGITDSARNASI